VGRLSALIVPRYPDVSRENSVNDHTVTYLSRFGFKNQPIKKIRLVVKFEFHSSEILLALRAQKRNTDRLSQSRDTWSMGIPIKC
jgi:hypothetical protein